MEKLARGMVAAVNHDVTIRAGAILQHGRLLIHCRFTAGGYSQELSRMKGIRVAALAKQGLLHAQQWLIGAAVRIVAVEAAFTNRRVVPNDWAALFGMTLVTFVVD